MDFCSSCGILLSLDLVGKKMCTPCARDRADQANRGGCNCDMCKTSSPPPSSRDTVMGDNVVNKSYESRSAKNIKPKKSKRTKQKVVFDQFDKYVPMEEETTQPQHDEVWSHPPAVCDWAMETSVDWTQQENEDWGATIQPPADWSIGIDDRDDFYVDTKDSKPTKWTEVNRKKSPYAKFGDHDFPCLERGLKESAVLESVRAGWEKEQEEYKTRLQIKDTPDITRLVSGCRRKHKNKRYYVGGVDISFIKGNNTDACACLSVVRLPDLELVYQAMEMIELTQPYIPGYLAFREVPALTTLFSYLKAEAPQYMPDVIMVDGNGILHPRGFGLASHLGVTLDIPTVGVAKSLITAQGITEDNEHKRKKQDLPEAGAGFDLIADSGEILGKCVRVHDGAPNPVYVSVGHKITLKSAVWLVLECSKYRIPEPIRRADLDSREYIRQGKKEPVVFIKK